MSLKIDPWIRSNNLFINYSKSNFMLMNNIKNIHFSISYSLIFVGDVIMRTSFRVFWAEVTWPHGHHANDPFLAPVFLETRLRSCFLESLIGFLEYLDTKLWLKNRKLSEK